MDLKDLIGFDLGTHELAYDQRDSILYALAVGTPTEQLDLVYERDIKAALPTYACALGLWAVEATGNLGAYDRTRSLHASQKLVMHAPMPSSGPIQTTGRVVNVWDKGKASIVEIEVSSDIFTATYSIFLPGIGGWGGERGASSTPSHEPNYNWSNQYQTAKDQATLYRLTGDLHPVHIDIETAQANGFDRPILHGLCTMGIAAREIAAAANAHPADLIEIECKLASPVLPGDSIEVMAGTNPEGGLDFQAAVGETIVLKGGRAAFRS